MASVYIGTTDPLGSHQIQTSEQTCSQVKSGGQSLDAIDDDVWPVVIDPVITFSRMAGCCRGCKGMGYRRREGDWLREEQVRRSWGGIVGGIDPLFG
jgi:hypothetical protein